MATITLRPNSVGQQSGSTPPPNWTKTGGGAGTGAGWAQCLNDDSDASYISDNAADGGTTQNLAILFPSTGLAATNEPVFKSMTMRVRASQASGSSQMGFSVAAYFVNNYVISGTQSPEYTIAPTSTIQTFTLPTWTGVSGVDAVNNTAYVGVRNLGTAPDDHRFYELYVDAVYNENPVPTVSVNAPTGSTTPTVSWANVDAEGDPQAAYWVKVFASAVYGAGGFDPMSSTAYLWASGTAETVGSDTSVVTGALPVATAHRAYVGVRDSNHAAGYAPSSVPPNRGLRFAYAQFDITANEVAPAVLSLVDDTAGAKRVQVGLAGGSNLLTSNQSSLETDTTGWAAQTNCSVSRVTTQSLSGSASMQMSSTAAGNMSANTPTGSSGVPVSPSTTYQAYASFKAATVGRSVRVDVFWYKSNGTASSVRASDSGVAVADVTTGWTGAVLTAGTVISPSDAAFASVVVNVLATGGAAELHYVDKVSIQKGGTGVGWTRGGLAQTVRLERSDDGGTTWNLVPGMSAIPLATNADQTATVYDIAAPRGITPQYRTLTTGTDSTGSYTSSYTSGVGIATATLGGFYLKDPYDQTNATALRLSVRGSLRTSKKEVQGKFRPLGRSRVVVISDGVLGEDLSLPLNFYNAATYNSFEALRALGRTLLLQSDMAGIQWYVRLGEDRQAELMVSTARLTAPYRAVDIDASEVDTPT